jgi:hypothetical protein
MHKLRLITMAFIVMAVLTTVGTVSASAELGVLPNTITLIGTSGASVFSTASGLEIKCTLDKLDGGTFKTDKEGGIANIEFEGCKALGLFAANTSGDPSGEILLHLATFTIGFINKGTLQMGVSLHLGGTVKVEVPAAKSSIEIKGSAVGALFPIGSKVKVVEMIFEATKGKQTFTKLEGGFEETLSAVLTGGKPESAGWRSTQQLATSASAEVMES